MESRHSARPNAALIGMRIRLSMRRDRLFLSELPSASLRGCGSASAVRLAGSAGAASASASIASAEAAADCRESGCDSEAGAVIGPENDVESCLWKDLATE